MDLFDVHRRDVYNFDQYMDLKKPGFGGNDSLIYDRDENGKKTSESNKLKDYRRVVKRDPVFKNPHYNSTYKAMTHDLVYKQEGEKPFTYRDPYLTGIATVEVGEYENEEETNESAIPSFNSFIGESVNEQFDWLKKAYRDAAEAVIGKENTDKLIKTAKTGANWYVDTSKKLWTELGKGFVDYHTDWDTFKETNKKALEIVLKAHPLYIANPAKAKEESEKILKSVYNKGKKVNENKNWKDVTGKIKKSVDIDPNVEKAMKEEADKLEKLKKEINNSISEGKCFSFDQFSNISEDWGDANMVYMDTETAPETEEDIQIDTEEYEGPENPPRRRINPAPKNMGNLEKAIEDLMDYMGISRSEAEDILAIDVIKDLEAADTETAPETEEDIQIDTEEYEGPENPPRRRVNPAPKNKYEMLDDILGEDPYGEGPGCGSSYGEGPGCGA